jgi:hypothetical protein
VRADRFALIAALASPVAACAPRVVQAPQPVRLGDAMAEAGQRFHRAARAVAAGRWELATYDLHELGEVFADDLATSTWHGRPELSRRSHDFQAHELTAIATAVAARDRAAFDQAVAATAKACNACHHAADVAYIEISPEAGAEVPLVDGPPATARR